MTILALHTVADPWTPALPLRPDDLNRLLFQVEQARRGLLGLALESLQLNFSQWVVLEALLAEGASSMKSLAKAIGVDRTTLTRTLDGLVSRDLALRRTPPQDRRLVLVALTDEGERLARSAQARVGPLQAELCGGLSGAEIGMTAGALARILTRAQRIAAGLGPGDPASMSA